MSEAPTTTEAPGPKGPVKLHCLGGQSPAPEIAADLRALLALPEGARARLWEVLAPSLSDPIPREVEGHLARFVEAHGADAGVLVRGLKAARILVRLAAALDLDAARFGEDLAAISGGATLGEALLPGYERGKAIVRAEIVRSTAADHGRLLERVRWRVDMMGSSDRGVGLRVPMVTLTLHYRDGDRREQLSLQVLPDVLKQLRGICDRVLGKK